MTGNLLSTFPQTFFYRAQKQISTFQCLELKRKTNEKAGKEQKRKLGKAVDDTVEEREENERGKGKEGKKERRDGRDGRKQERNFVVLVSLA